MVNYSNKLNLIEKTLIICLYSVSFKLDKIKKIGYNSDEFRIIKEESMAKGLKKSGSSKNLAKTFRDEGIDEEYLVKRTREILEGSNEAAKQRMIQSLMNLFNEISPEEIKKILEKISPDQAIKRLQVIISRKKVGISIERAQEQ